MSKFKCIKKKCKKVHKDSSVESRLVLTLVDSEWFQYYLNDDGTLDYFDGDDDSQKRVLKCPLCETEYEFFGEPFGAIEKMRMLPVKEYDVKIRQKK